MTIQALWQWVNAHAELLSFGLALSLAIGAGVLSLFRRNAAASINAKQRAGNGSINVISGRDAKITRSDHRDDQ